jgi:hypothetical protein
MVETSSESCNLIAQVSRKNYLLNHSKTHTSKRCSHSHAVQLLARSIVITDMCVSRADGIAEEGAD